MIALIWAGCRDPECTFWDPKCTRWDPDGPFIDPQGPRFDPHGPCSDSNAPCSRFSQISSSSSSRLSLLDLGAHLASPAVPGGEAGIQQGASENPRQQSATPQGIEL